MDEAVRTQRAPVRSEALVEALRQELAARGIKEYLLVDHAGDMRDAGAPLHPAFTLIFGNPRLGSALLAESLDAVVDIPLRMGVYQDQDEAVLVYRDMAPLLNAYGPERERLAQLAAQVNGVLEAVASAGLARAGRQTP
ncbi:MAG: DUF302 domain-containing protein [Thermaerobacter sp.]|jgi:uncharacterized protein (DUF302 family)|nr:DUF302 domain-containing protein [Thermaerobacter sp.]